MGLHDADSSADRQAGRLSKADLAELLLPDPALMGSPEGDIKGLRELQDAAQRQIEEHST
jgi:hypothetical protein